MCLATVRRRADGTAVFKNVSRIDVEGERLIIRDIMGEATEIEGRLLMVDLANSLVEIECL